MQFVVSAQTNVSANFSYTEELLGFFVGCVCNILFFYIDVHNEEKSEARGWTHPFLHIEITSSLPLK